MTNIDLMTLVARGEALSFFQPIYHVDDPSRISYEVLGRMMLDGKLLQPGQFLPLLEGTPHLEQFDRNVLTKALRQVKWWKEDGQYVHIHVNASTEAIESDTYLRVFEDLIPDYGIDFEQVTVELLETCSFWERPVALAAIARLREYGIQIAIDDFPCWASPDKLLDFVDHDQRGSFHALKLDRSIVLRATHEDRSVSDHAQEEVNDYVSFAHHHGMEVIAEGVENDKVIALMSERFPIDAYQGFGIGRPQPALCAYHTTSPRHILQRHAAAYA